MVIVISTIILSWASALVKTQQSTIENKTMSGVECATADVNIESVFLDFTTNVSRVIIRNSGQADYSIISTSLVNNVGDSCPYLNSTNLTSASIWLTKGSITTVKFNMSGFINACVNFSYALVSTNCAAISDKFTGSPTCI